MIKRMPCGCECCRDWGQDKKYNHLYKGFNYRMDSIQAAILGVKLRYIENWTEARREVAPVVRRSAGWLS